MLGIPQLWNHAQYGQCPSWYVLISAGFHKEAWSWGCCCWDSPRNCVALHRYLLQNCILTQEFPWKLAKLSTLVNSFDLIMLFAQEKISKRTHKCIGVDPIHVACVWPFSECVCMWVRFENLSEFISRWEMLWYSLVKEQINPSKNPACTS